MGAILLAVVVVVAGLGGYFYFAHRPGPAAAPVIADGPTLKAALTAVNTTVRNASGGPWNLFSVYGIASPAPFSPNVIGYGGLSNNWTVNRCGQAFNGVTLWNGSIPLFHGTFNSGTAPFWQFGFYSNSSDQFLVATDVVGIPHVYPPITANQSRGQCYPWYDFSLGPSHWTGELSNLGVDSSVRASAAWAVANQSLVTANEPMVEIMTMGPGMYLGFGDVNLGYLGVYFERCGIVDVAGETPLVQIAVSPQGQALGGILANQSTNCAVWNAGHGSYDGIDALQFGAPNQSFLGLTQQVETPFQIAQAYPNGTLTNDYDGWGVANWMTSWNLTNASGQHLPLTTPTCRGWVPSVADCGANSSGWYAVVLSASGGWINSYGALPGGGVGWSEPVTALVSQQQVVIVAPSSWTLSGDQLSVTSTVSTTTVTGTVSL